jgi:hypothetical protein
MTSNGRVGRLTALALATGTLVAVGSSTASAATTTTVTDQIQALGAGTVVHLHVALPAGVSVPGVGNVIDQYISTTNGTVTTVGNLGATSVARIGQGQVPILSDILKGSAISDLAGKQSDKTAAFDGGVAALGLTAKILGAESKVFNPKLDGTLSKSNSTVTSIKMLNLLGLPALSAAALPVQDALETTLGTVTETANTATGTIVGVLDQAQATIASTTPAAAGTTQTVIDQTKTALQNLSTTLQTQISGLDANSALVDLGVMTSDQTISRTGHQVTSTVTNKLAGIGLLGGLITIDALESSASATAGGAPGTAKAIAGPSRLVKAKVADLLTLEVIGKNLNIKLGGTLGEAIKDTGLEDQVNAALAQVTALLTTTLGLQVTGGEAFAPTPPANGTSATAVAGAAVVSLMPEALKALMPAGEKHLLRLELVRAEAAVGAQVVSLTKTTKPNAAPVSREVALPRTGANLPLTGAVAVVLVGLAMAARRRQLAQISE